MFADDASATRPSNCAPEVAWAFLQAVISAKNLGIGSSLNQFVGTGCFLLVAGTGLGKTVVLPIYLWYRQLLRNRDRQKKNGLVDGISRSDSPRVWVVEPKIAIVQSLHHEMNAEWNRWHDRHHRSQPAPLFGCKTKVDHSDVDAPIMFISTGIFPIFARKGVFRRGRDIVIIDEAHVTLETDEAVELAIGVCRGAGVPVHYMSATVRSEGLEAKLGVKLIEIPGKRFPVWLHNTKVPLNDCIVDLVETALIRQDTSSPLFPSNTTPTAAAIVNSVTETGRAKGMLVIVNSYSSERSDARRVEQLLRASRFASAFEVGLLAGEVLRAPDRKKRFHAMVDRWQSEKRRFVLIATSVVEMGVTLPDLDFVVTMDAGFGLTDEIRPGRVALGTNALVQRAGRVGRVRPGIAYITNDVGAPYSVWDDAVLNHRGTLAPEPIHFPMETSRLTWLAFETLARNWSDDDLFLLGAIPLPTPIFTRADRMNQLRRERAYLWELGVRYGSEQSDVSRFLERWIGRIDLGCAAAVHAAVQQDDSEGVLRAFCRGVLREMPLDAVCDSERFHRARGPEAPPEDVYRLFIVRLERRLAPGLSTWYERHRLEEHVGTMMLRWGVHEAAFLRALMLVVDYFETFLRVVEDPPPAVHARVERWQASLKEFLGT